MKGTKWGELLKDPVIQSVQSSVNIFEVILEW